MEIRRLRVIRVLIGALLLGYLLFAHGCHSHEDDELFIRLIQPQVTR